MVAVAVSFIIVDRSFIVLEGHYRLASIRVGPDVQPLDLASLTRVMLLEFYLSFETFSLTVRS